jgi:hypothetical protein
VNIAILWVSGKLAKLRLGMRRHLLMFEGRDHKIQYVNATDRLVPVKGADAVILHPTLCSHRCGDRHEMVRRHLQWLRDTDAVTVAMPQDECDYHGRLDRWLSEFGIDVVFSCLYEPNGLLYPQTRKTAKIIPCLPGYIDDFDLRATGPRRKSQPLATRVAY